MSTTAALVEAPQRRKRPTSGREQFMLAFLLAFGALIGCVALQVALYARPAPDGGPFIAEWNRYFWLANYYDMLGVWLLSLPFFALWLVLYRRQLSFERWRWVPVLHAAVLALNLFLSELDHEILRFLGVRLNPSFLMAYGTPKVMGDGLFLEVLGSDRGGAWLPLVLLLAIPGLYLWWALRRVGRPVSRTVPLWFAVLLAIVPLAAPANGWRMATSQFRLRKVEPVILAFATDIAAGYADLEQPPDFAEWIKAHQTAWLERSTDKGWRFPALAYPYLRVPTGVAPEPSEAWNVIYLQLETMRGMETGFMRPDLVRSPTPFLDQLARSPNSAVWTRALSVGMPSINGIFAIHCSVVSPSRRYVTALTHVDFHCLPNVLRRRGYRAEMFHGDDTDWDNSTPWFLKWYDRLWRYGDAQRRDRELFRRAGERIRQLGRSGKPFFAAVVSVNNHTPFASREPEFDIAGTDTAAERINNTTHYTDYAVRELIEGIKDEPWFGRTLIVITGDHGFNVGEHGQITGQHNLYRESLWVPLIIAGPHPRLAPGMRDDPASLLDLAPTLADLLGIREANPWQGNSLLAIEPTGHLAFGFRDSLVTETPEWSAVLDPASGQERLFRRRDWLQQHDLASRYPALAQRLIDQARRTQRAHDYLLRQDRIWPAKPS